MIRNTTDTYQLHYLSTDSCRNSITKSDSYGLQWELVYLQLTSNYALIAATKLALQDKGFIAMSNAIAFPSSTTQRSSWSIILITHKYPELPFWRGVIKGSIQKSPGVVRETRETRTRSLEITNIRPQARGAANVHQLWRRRTTPPWQCLPEAPFCGGVIKGSNSGVQGKPAVQENPEGKGTGYTGMRTTRVHERTRTKGSCIRNAHWRSCWLCHNTIPSNI